MVRKLAEINICHTHSILKGSTATIASMDTTTIEISTRNWRWLNLRKEPGESFNDVLDRLRSQVSGDKHMSYWHIMVSGRNARYRYIGRVQGSTLEDAVLNGMEEDYQFRTQVQEFVGSEEIPEVEFYGFQQEQLDSTVINSDKLTGDTHDTR